MSKPRVLSVGQCGFDNRKIGSYFESEFEATFEKASSAASALKMMRAQPFQLVLVNRLLDADGASGVDVIRAIKADPALAATPTMLVSNYADAQAQAVAAGALPGFGKAELDAPATREALAAVFDPAAVR